MAGHRRAEATPSFGRLCPAMTNGCGFVKAIVIGLVVAVSASGASAQSLPAGFTLLRDVDPSILQDIRYAGANNFVGRRLSGYGAAECVVKRDVGLALKRVQEQLAPQRLSLKMLDCYRPARAVHDMVLWAQNGRETPAERRYNPAFSKKICSGSAISPSIPAIPPAPPSTSRWSI
jgi:D-alanyl-D-alanine dipeptidase